MADPTTNPCGEITLGGRMSGKQYTRPGVYIQSPNPPVGTVREMVKGFHTLKNQPFQTVQVIHAGNGKWLTTSVDQSEEAGRSTQSLVDKLKEIEELFELGDQVGFVISEDKTREYNAVEEELIRRFEQNPPLTVDELPQFDLQVTLDTSPGSAYDTMMQPFVEEAKRIAKQIKDNLDA